MTTTQRVQTDVAATLDIDDVWDLNGTFGSLRWGPAGTYVANPGMFDRIYRFTPAGSTTDPQAMPTREGRSPSEARVVGDGQHDHDRLQGLGRGFGNLLMLKPLSVSRPR